jgi:hypothetical protein
MDLTRRIVNPPKNPEYSELISEIERVSGSLQRCTSLRGADKEIRLSLPVWW